MTEYFICDLAFTGVDAPYEAPEQPDVSIDTSLVTVDRAVQMIIEKLAEQVSFFLVKFQKKNRFQR